MHRFGTVYGGFHYPKDLDGLDERSIIYCVGAGEDISHDIEIAKKLGSEVYIFDPTPRAIDHVNYIKALLDGEAPPVDDKRFGGGDPMYLERILKNKIDSSKIHLKEYGVYTVDGDVKFYAPSHKEYVSHSVVREMKGDDYITVKVKTLMTIMADLGHESIDLLKIDIEGCECNVLDQMVENGVYPRYLSIDFDLGWNGERMKDRKRCEDTIEMLQNKGYKLLHSDGSDYSFQL